jgi:hypothetical protein
MKNFFKYFILCSGFLLNTQYSFSCQTVDYIFDSKPENINRFNLTEVKLGDNLADNFLGISEKEIQEKYESVLNKSFREIHRMPGSCYFNAFKDHAHFNICSKNMRSLHPEKKFEESAAFFGFIAYFFNRSIEIWIDDSDTKIRQIRAFNAAQLGRPIRIFFNGNDIFLLKEKELKPRIERAAAF